MKRLFFFAILFNSFFIQAQNWQKHFNEAKTLAQKENKNIVLVFSGSDWCAPCIKLDNNVWKSDVFQQEATKLWVIYKADFPKKKANKLATELTKENEALAEKYNKNGVFPLVLLLNPDGKVLGTMGYENSTAIEYVNKLKALSKI